MIQEIISTSPDEPGHLSFTADSAALEVPVDGPGLSRVRFENSIASYWFLPGDNILLQKVWTNIPYGFGQGSGRLRLGLRWSFEGGGSQAIPEFGGSSGTESFLVLPGVACSLEFPGNGLFLRVPTSETEERFFLGLYSIDLNVSMVNLPDSLNGELVQAQFHCLIQHSKIMQPGS